SNVILYSIDSLSICTEESQEWKQVCDEVLVPASRSGTLNPLHLRERSKKHHKNRSRCNQGRRQTRNYKQQHNQHHSRQKNRSCNRPRQPRNHKQQVLTRVIAHVQKTRQENSESYLNLMH